MKKKIKIWIFTLWPPYNSCNSLRFVSPFSYFPDDFEFTFAPSLKALVTLGVVPDAVVFHRILYPFAEADKILSFCRSRGVLTGLDVDDYITDLPFKHPSYQGYNALKEQIEGFIRGMDFVTVSTERLRQFFLPYNKDIYVLPNLVDSRIWDSDVKKEKHSCAVVIGYAGSEPHGYDFKPVIPAIRYISEKYPGRVLFRFIGYSPGELKGLPGVSYTRTIESYGRYAQFIRKSAFDIALAPLEGNTYSEGKSNIKFLEYSMCGYPGIYSRVGAYLDTVAHNETGILTGNSTHEWIEAMECLIWDEQLRRRMGANAYQYVTRNYSLQTRFAEWVKVYRNIIASGGKKKAGEFSFIPALSFGPYLAYAQFRECYYFMRRGVRALIRAVKKDG